MDWAYYIEYLKTPAKKYSIDKSNVFDPYSYTQEIDDLITNLYETKIIIQFEWPEWQEKAAEFIKNPDKIKVASLIEVKMLLTTIVRKNRFCSGFVAYTIDEGILLLLMQRLNELPADIGEGAEGTISQTKNMEVRK